MPDVIVLINNNIRAINKGLFVMTTQKSVVMNFEVNSRAITFNCDEFNGEIRRVYCETVIRTPTNRVLNSLMRGKKNETEINYLFRVLESAARLRQVNVIDLGECFHNYRGQSSRCGIEEALEKDKR